MSQNFNFNFFLEKIIIFFSSNFGCFIVFHLILKHHILPKYDESTHFFVKSVGIVFVKFTKVNKIAISLVMPWTKPSPSIWNCVIYKWSDITDSQYPQSYHTLGWSCHCSHTAPGRCRLLWTGLKMQSEKAS